MNGKFITPQLMIACLSGERKVTQDIHAELQKTINERKKILKNLEHFSRQANPELIYQHCHHAA
jgi:hypothetical protein